VVGGLVHQNKESKAGLEKSTSPDLDILVLLQTSFDSTILLFFHWDYRELVLG
jgi:hypothetical protein